MEKVQAVLSKIENLGRSSHWGTFVCKASNPLGHDTAEITLAGEQVDDRGQLHDELDHKQADHDQIHEWDW